MLSIYLIISSCVSYCPVVPLDFFFILLRHCSPNVFLHNSIMLFKDRFFSLVFVRPFHCFFVLLDMKLLSILKSSSKSSSNKNKLFWIRLGFTPLTQEPITMFFHFCEDKRTCPYFRNQTRRRPNRFSGMCYHVSPRFAVLGRCFLVRVIITLFIANAIFYSLVLPSLLPLLSSPHNPNQLLS
jgi:hypothetical protein